MQTQMFRLLTRLEVQGHGFTDVPLKIAEPVGLSRQPPAPLGSSHEATRTPVSSQVLIPIVISSMNPILSRISHA